MPIARLRTMPQTLHTNIDDDMAVDWHLLSGSAVKGQFFKSDGDFREGLADACDVMGRDAPGILQQTAMLLFKPEAIAGRRVRRTLHALRNWGFGPIASARVEYDARLIHAIWRYQTNVASVDRIRLQTRYNCPNATILVLFSDRAPDKTLPSSLRLKRYKGAANPAIRDCQSLRALLDSPNYLLNFIHSPDEPADILREINICLPPQIRREVLTDVRRHDEVRAAPALENAIQLLENDCPYHDFDLAQSLARVGLAVAHSSRVRSRAGRKLQRLLDRISAGAQIKLSALERAFDGLSIKADRNDMFTIASAAVAANSGSVTPLISDDGANGWRSGAAGPLTRKLVAHLGSVECATPGSLRLTPRGVQVK